MHIRIINTGTKDYDEMADLRMKVLLDPIGIPRSYINPEKEKEDILLGAFENDVLIGCCILTPIDHGTIQLRQMAVEDTFQKKGVGKGIVAFAEATAQNKGYRLVILHARDNVSDFYKKSGYQVWGERFFEVGIGHYKMQKEIKAPYGI